MNHYAICNRCNQLDKERFGSYTLCPIRITKIYTCFDCSELCNYCNSRPQTILHSIKPLRYACKTCYDRLERIP